MTPHEQFSARDERWVHALLAILLAVISFAMGMILETNRALSHARERMAEWKAEARKEIAADEMQKAHAIIQQQWPCDRHEPSETGFICTVRVLKR